jgi:hypothetical protein
MDEKLSAFLTKIINEQARQGVALDNVIAEQAKTAGVLNNVVAEQNKQATLLNSVIIEQNKQAAVQAKLTDTQAKQAADISEIKDLLKAMYPLMIGASVRSEEQAKRIDDQARILASLVPQKLAAVGER